MSRMVDFTWGGEGLSVTWGCCLMLRFQPQAVGENTDVWVLLLLFSPQFEVEKLFPALLSSLALNLLLFFIIWGGTQTLKKLGLMCTAGYPPHCKFALAFLSLVATCAWIDTERVSRAIWNTDEILIRFLNLRRPFKRTEEWKKRDLPADMGCLSPCPSTLGHLLSGSNFCLPLTFSWVT